MAATVTTVVYLIGALAGKPSFISYEGYGSAIAVPMPNMQVCQQVKEDIEFAFIEKADIDSSVRNQLRCKEYIIDSH